MAYLSTCVRGISSLLRKPLLSACIQSRVLPQSVPFFQHNAARALHASLVLRDRDDGFKPRYERSFDNSEDYSPGSRGRSNNSWDSDRRGGGGRRSFNSFYDEIESSAKTPLDKSKLIPLEKDFFKPSQELFDRSAEDNQKFLDENNITLKGSELPPPIQQFAEQEFPADFQVKLEQFSAPTAIQAQGWSVALSGRDFIGIGQTGSGKTLGFLLPCIIHVMHHSALYRGAGTAHDDAPLALVLAPTRELVQQIMQVAGQYARGTGVEVVSMFGGMSKNVQLDNFSRRRAQLVVGCPGRILDFMQSGEIQFGRCGFVVLDEADRMLDMGFEPQIRQIVDTCRDDRQTMMWSATWPEEVQELAEAFLHNPVQLSVGSTELRANPDIRQLVDVVSPHEKLDRLTQLLDKLLENNPSEQVMVFCETKRMADRVSDHLRRGNYRAGAIHGDKSQRGRDEVLNAFRRGRLSALVATDVASRGIDIPKLGCVVNYDMPNNVESYVHRIGRTGRCGNEGLAYSFITDRDDGVVRPLIKVLEDAGQPINTRLQALAASLPSSNKHGKQRYGNDRFGIGGNRGGSYGGNRGGSYGGNRGGSYGGNRGGSYGGNRGGNRDGGYGGNRGGYQRNYEDDGY